jgi:hypothetical protein
MRAAACGELKGVADAYRSLFSDTMSCATVCIAETFYFGIKFAVLGAAVVRT